ncbi:hypothetical protein [Funiculus sociatus]
MRNFLQVAPDRFIGALAIAIASLITETLRTISPRWNELLRCS